MPQIRCPEIFAGKAQRAVIKIKAEIKRQPFAKEGEGLAPCIMGEGSWDRWAAALNTA